MSEDAAHQLSQNRVQASNPLADIYISSYLLNELDKLLKDAGYCLSRFNLPLPDDTTNISGQNRLLLDELNYDVPAMTATLHDNLSMLNNNQKDVFDAIYNSMMNAEGQTFFVYGYGGTGKTFLWTTLLNSVRSKGKIALAVASSGIASLLLPWGRTPHSCFKIPLDISQSSMCSIKKNTHLAELIQKTSLIVWDEAPANHRYCFEALDRTLRDILSEIRQNAENKQFGGITVVLGGDFRQTLPVIHNATKAQILRSCIVNSYLWRQCKLLELTENMRLKSGNLSTLEREELSNFAEWLLRVGNGTEPIVSVPNDSSNSFIKIPESLLLSSDCRNLDGLISFVYDLGSEPANISSYLCQRAILAPTNEVVSDINTRIIAQLKTTEMSYYSSDSIDDSTANHSTLEALYPIEFLNTIPMPGLPDHKLHLKIGVPIMLFRNLDPSRGLCNGTRLIVTQLTNHVIEGEIITGKATGSKEYYINGIHYSP
ncbi:ATP-dependent DNA helicase PIF1-like [Triticum aestivum]|uniref:ATP-dependent DNA helicase PIF1-like n=1 Tax=Triticum aestivum TaxID=4565 RepID=UPI001D02D8C0|nr:ATP-dependent DNA helicase PIF1-like [Triticum aestivum]